ncbi:MAG: MoxR family ATPase [Pseudomonadota bacterium]|nr:MoxR family ATPase [Pseudomonadota bacterium]
MIKHINDLKTWLETKIIGQESLVERLIIALLSDGHVLVEGAPGLAKTKAIKTLSEGLEADFHRIQFTPDLLPADVTGSDIYKPKEGTFEFQKGPIFHNLVLADEINRAPAKVQSALLEAMAERQISVGKSTYKLPELFLVMATQNPIEQEGTYALPEAQMDRFLLHVKIDYPSTGSERKILELSRDEKNSKIKGFENPLTQSQLNKARAAVRDVRMSEQVEEYLVQIILATRNSDKYGGNLSDWLEFGASPRATIALDICSKSLAWLDNRNFVTPDDIRSIAHDVLRHRLILSFEAEANGISSDQVVDELLKVVPSA